MTPRTIAIVVPLALAGLVGCSDSGNAVGKAAPAPSEAAAVDTPKPGPPATVCALIAASTMSEFLGTPVKASANDDSNSTECVYQPDGRAMPYVSLKISWGEGRAAMMGMNVFGRLEPDMKAVSNSLDGIGDEAMTVGPQLMIRVGEDLITIVTMGVDDVPAFARRMVGTMRPRMGSSSQPQKASAGGDGNDESAKAVESILGGLLSSLPRGADKEGATKPSRESRSSATSVNRPETEETFSPFSGTAPRIPLVAGLTLVSANHEPGRGDYEALTTVNEVSDRGAHISVSADLPEGTHLSVKRQIRNEDLADATRLRGWFHKSDDETFVDTTAIGLSRRTMSAIKKTGEAAFQIFKIPENLLAPVWNGPDEYLTGTLRRVEPHNLAVPVLVNDEPVHLPAVHVRGTFGGVTYDFLVLDDESNPILLRAHSGGTDRTVRITFPIARAEHTLETKLKETSRVELHGIYFDFSKATLRPESEPVLRDIATALTNNPSWSINIEGHTDNIGGDDYNLSLSKRRAAAVKSALVDRFHIAADRLNTDGFGATRPRESNDTLSGRGRNRRVELVRR